MKKFFLVLTLFAAATLCLSTAFAQYEPYTQVGIPEGAIARFSKGSIREIMYFPDGARLAVATTIGVWIYNAQTGETLDLIIGGHTDKISSAAYSPDGKTIATASWDETVRLWDVRTGKNTKTLKGHTYGISSVVYSPDGKTIATASSDKTIRLWNARTGRNIKTLEGHTEAVISVKFLPDGKTIATAGADKTIRLWNTHTGKPTNIFDGYQNPIAFSPDGNTLLGTSSINIINGAVQMWDVHTGQPIKTLPSSTPSQMSRVSSITYSADGKTIATGHWDGTMRLWNANSGQSIQTFKTHTNRVISLAFSSDEKTIATASWDGTMRWWNTNSGENIKTFTGYIGGSHSITYSPDGKIIAVTGGGKVNLWNASGKHLKTLKGHKGYVTSIRFSPNGQTLITGGSADKTVKYWNIHTGENIDTLNSRKQQLWDTDTREYLKTFDDDVYGKRWFVFSPDRKILATRFNDSVRLHDVHKGNIIQILIGHTGRPQRGVFSSDSSKIITYAKDGTFRLWDAHTGENIKTLNITGKPITVVYSPDGDPLAITANKETVSLWNVETEQLLKTFEGHKIGIIGSLTRSLGKKNERTREGPPSGGPPSHVHTVRYSPNGGTLATVRNNGTVQLWDVDKGGRIGKLIKPFKDDPANAWIEYSPDGRTLVTTQIGNFGGTPRLWDAATGKYLKILKGILSCGNLFEFSPDSKTIATGHYDGTIILWDIPN